MRNEGTSSASQKASPSRGSDDHVKWRSRLQQETWVVLVYLFIYFRHTRCGNKERKNTLQNESGE